MEKTVKQTIEELFAITEVEKGDVDAKVLRQGCLSVQTPNTTETK